MTDAKTTALLEVVKSQSGVVEEPFNKHITYANEAQATTIVANNHTLGHRCVCGGVNFDNFQRNRTLLMMP